jgi:hypothetical protein
MTPARGPIRQEYPDKKARRPAAFLMIFQGVEMMQKREMKRVARKMLMYLGQRPVTSLENGYEPIEREKMNPLAMPSGFVKESARTYRQQPGYQWWQA